MLLREFSCLACVAVLVGCASTPDVTAKYFLPKAETTLTVTQSFSCIGKGDSSKVVVAAVVSPNTVYSADLADSVPLNFKDMGTLLVDADTALSFYPDGRLQSINGTNAGQGSAIVNDAITNHLATGSVTSDGADGAGVAGEGGRGSA